MVDKLAPAVNSVTIGTANTTYTDGDQIPVTVTFTEPVTITGGTIDITLSTGDVISIPASALSGDGLSITGNYTVSPDDNANPLTVTSIVVSGGAVSDQKGNSTTTLPVPADNPVSTVKVDGTPTSVTDFAVTSTDPDVYSSNDSMTVQITFSENITLSPGSTIDITLDSGQVIQIPASLLTGGGSTAQVTFSIQDGAFGTDPLTITGITISGGGSLSDAAGNVTNGSQLTSNTTLPLANTSGTVITVDGITQTPTLISPAANSTDNDIMTLNYTLPETALNPTVKITFTQTGGTGDPGSPHVIRMVSETSDNISLDASALLANNAGVVEDLEAGTASLVDGAIYTVRLQYQDQWGNDAGFVENANFVYDISTLAPDLLTPVSGTKANALNLSYTLPETALNNSVKITFTKTGGVPADPGSPHVVTMTSESGQSVVLDATNFSGDTDVSSVAGGNSLVDGVIYDIKLEYQDSLGNPIASDTHVSFTYDNAAVTPTLLAPADNAVDDATFSISYTIPETAKDGTVKLVFTHTGGDPDPGSPHTLTMVSETSQSFTLNATNLGAVSDVESVTGGSSLVDGAKYTVRLEYQDVAGNSAFDQNTLVIYSNDTVTETPTLITPADSATDDSTFAVSYTIPEPAKDGTVKLVFTRSGGTNDPASPHTVTMVSEVSQAFFPLTGTNLSGTAGVATVTGGNSLMDGTVYTVRIEYQDFLGNAVAFDENTGVTFDNSTQAPVLITPTENSSGKGTFNVSYTIPETASAGTVKLTFTQSGGSIDGGSPHMLRMVSETSANITLDATALLANNSGIVEAIENGSPSLVNGSIYIVKIEYQDAMGHTASFDTNINFTYDNATQAPTLISPADSGTGSTSFTVNYTIPETASDNTVKLTFTQTGGTTDAGSPHVLTMTSEVSQSFSLNATDLAGNAGVASVTGGNSLVNGAQYTVRIQYQDLLLNTAAYDDNTNFTYDTVTQNPTLTAPADSATVDNDFSVTYTIPETAQDGTVKLTLTRTGGTADAGSPHVLTMTSEAGQTLALNTTALGSTAGIDSYTNGGGGGSLVNGTVYTLRIQYQDALGNGVAFDDNTLITFDNATLTPLLNTPAVGSRDNATLAVSYTIPEAATDNTVKLTFTSTAGSDSGLTYVLQMSDNTSGTKSFAVDGSSLSSTPGVESRTGTGDNDLVDGSTYSVKIEYQDQYGHTAASATNANFTYDVTTQAPTFDFPAASTGYGDPMAIKYTIPETALDNSVKLTFTWVSGTADGNHTVTMVSEGSQDTTLMVSNFSGDTKVQSYTGGNSLVSGALYNVTLEYQDSSGNTAASLIHNSVNYGDITTQTPILTAPAANSFDNGTITVTYAIEQAKNASVKLTFTYASGSIDAGHPTNSR